MMGLWSLSTNKIHTCYSSLTQPVAFPFLSGISLEEGKHTPPMDCTIYQQLIGSLLYLTHSKPNICYAMNAVSRYMQHPHDIHWKLAKRILQYI